MDTETIKTITRFLKPLSINRTYNSKRGQRVILMYHGISKSPKFNCVTQSLFREQISWLKGRYSVVPLNTLIESFNSDFPTVHSDIASITFDDGYISFAELALPILQEYNCHATVFFPAGKAGSYNDWDQEISGFCKMEIMSYKMLRQLPIESVEIGSHGISHVALNGISFRDVEREIVESRLEIEQNISRPVQFFAFPFGAYPFNHRNMLYDNKKHFLGGYKAACTIWWGRYNSLKDINTLYRIRISDSDSFNDFTDKLKGYYDWLAGKERIGRYLRIIRSFL